MLQYYKYPLKVWLTTGIFSPYLYYIIYYILPYILYSKSINLTNRWYDYFFDALGGIAIMFPFMILFYTCYYFFRNRFSDVILKTLLVAVVLIPFLGVLVFVGWYKNTLSLSNVSDLLKVISPVVILLVTSTFFYKMKFASILNDSTQ